jgi:hypothetical protein
LESLLHRSILSSELPPPWWTKTSAALKRSSLQLALRTVRDGMGHRGLNPQKEAFLNPLAKKHLD